MSSDDASEIKFTELGGDRIDRRTVGKLFATAGLSGLAGCSGGDDVNPDTSGNNDDANTASDENGSQSDSGGTLRIGELQGNVKTIDPHRCSTDVCYRLIQYIHSGLVDVNRDFEIVPAIAENWETPDNTTVVFNIRDGVKWHNGDDFTADDWVYTLKRLRDEDTNAIYTESLEPVDNAVARDETTLEVNLKRPYAPLFAYLTPVGRAGVPINQNAVEEYGNQEYGNNPVGTGPFQLSEWESGGQVVLDAFDDYWGEPPNLDRVEVDLIADNNALVNALRSGAIHISPNIPTAQVSSLEGSDTIEAVTELTGNYHYISINCDREPFDQVKVRQAIMFGIDREAAVEAVFQGFAEPNGYPLSPAFDWAYPDEPSFQQYDPERAKELLAEAGYPDGFEATMLTPNLQPWRRGGEWLAEELGKIGIDAELKVMEWASFRERTASEPFEYDMFNLQWLGEVDPDQELSMFHKDSGLNRTNFENEEISDLIDQQRQETDRGKRAELLKNLTKRVAEVGPYACYASQRRTYGVSNKVEGFEPHPAMYINVSDITLSE